MARAPDSSDLWAPDSWLPAAWAPDSERSQLSLGRAIELFLGAKGAEGASPKTIQWYRMVLGRAARDLGADQALDTLNGLQLRDWLLTLRETLAPISVAGYVRGLKVLGNWCAAEELAEAKALRLLRRPKVPHKLVEPLSDDALRRLLDGASARDRAILLLFLDTGLRLSELASLRLVDLRADGSLKVIGKGSRERIVPVGTVARQALVRYLREAGADPKGAQGVEVRRWDVVLIRTGYLGRRVIRARRAGAGSPPTPRRRRLLPRVGSRGLDVAPRRGAPRA